MEMTVSVLITNYNTWDLTKRCIRELERCTKENHVEVVVIDDASTESVPEFDSDKVRVIKNLFNLGYVSSVNIGFKNLTSDIVVLLDSDAYPLVDFTKKIKSLFLDDSTLGAVGFHLFDEEGQLTGSFEPEPTSFGFVLGQKLEALIKKWLPTASKNGEDICLYSCGVAIRRLAFEDIQGFDEGFDFLDADLDFSMRLRQRGWNIQVDKELRAFHVGGGSPQLTSKRVLRYHQNRWRLLAKHQRLKMTFLLRVLLFSRHLTELLILNVSKILCFSKSEEIEDKISGRIKLIRLVWSGYGHK
jgi:GT2 family glycosyltransferase